MDFRFPGAYLVVFEEGLALGELVVLGEAAVEEVAHTRVVGQHQPTHTVARLQVR